MSLMAGEQSSRLTGFEQQNGDLTQVEVDEVLQNGNTTTHTPRHTNTKRQRTGNGWW